MDCYVHLFHRKAPTSQLPVIMSHVYEGKKENSTHLADHQDEIAGQRGEILMNRLCKGLDRYRGIHPCRVNAAIESHG